MKKIIRKIKKIIFWSLSPIWFTAILLYLFCHIFADWAEDYEESIK